MNNERNVRMMIVFDPNSSDSLEMVNILNPSDEFEKIEVQRVRKFFPEIRATPAVGVIMWASDLQGIVQNVDDFKTYIENEAENRQALIDAEEVAQAYVDLLAETIATENELDGE